MDALINYRAVGDRCAVNLDALCLPISRIEIMRILQSKGFRLIEADIVALARGCIGRSHYRRGARLFQAPEFVDCSSLMKWLYGQRGIWLPRRSIQQFEIGSPVGIDEIEAGDLVFVSGWIDYYFDDPGNGIGHVGIATNDRTIIHAANKRFGVVETKLAEFVGTMKFRGARRYIPKLDEVFTFESPKDREVETADDFRWIVLQSLT